MRRILVTITIFIFGFFGQAQEAFTEYHKNGKISIQGYKVEGKLVGEYASFYRDGTVESVARYNSGYLVQKKEYFNTGELMSAFYFIDGTEFFQVYFYYRNGQLEKKGRMDRSGLESGEWLYYSEDDNLLKSINYNKGEVVN